MDPNRLNILGMVEDPDRLEAAMMAEQAKSVADVAARTTLESIYLEADRERSFQRFRDGYEFFTIKKLLETFGVGKNDPICELGGGPGFLSWALTQSGYQDLHLMEPNGRFNTGTGYLRSRDDAKGITIHNDLNEWHAAPAKFPIIITKNCIHHFKNIPQAAATIRQKMTETGLWFAFREAFADTPGELYAQIARHPYSQPYGLYEWWYPSWHYVESLEMAGFRCKAIVPMGYANNTLCTYQENPGGPQIENLTKQVDDILRTNPKATVDSFWEEVLRNRFQNGNTRFWSRPQLMVFTVNLIT
jgi:hypothetical protein